MTCPCCAGKTTGATHGNLCIPCLLACTANRFPHDDIHPASAEQMAKLAALRATS